MLLSIVMSTSNRLRFLQQGKDLLPLHTGKTLEKVCNGVTGLKMVKQTLNRYSGPGKDSLASENFRVPRNDFPMCLPQPSNLPEPFPGPKGISAQIQDAVNQNQPLSRSKR
jgi:hypothetical protein